MTAKTRVSLLGLLLAVTAVALVLGVLECPGKVIAQHGSLVVMIPTRDGLIIAADKRLSDGNRSIVGTRTKVLRIDAQTVVASVGTPRLFKPNLIERSMGEVGNPIFDADDIVAKYFDSRPRLSSIYGQEVPIGALLTEEFKDAITSVLIRPPSGDGQDNAVCLTLLCHHNSKSSKYEAIWFTLHYVAQRPDPNIWTTSKSAAPIIFQTSGASTIGEVGVANEIAGGNNHHFDALRNSPYAHLFFRDPQLVETVSSAQGLDGAAHIILDTCQRMDMIDQSSFPVGDTMDAILLSPTGAKWIVQDRKCSDVIAWSRRHQ